MGGELGEAALNWGTIRKGGGGRIAGGLLNQGGKPFYCDSVSFDQIKALGTDYKGEHRTKIHSNYQGGRNHGRGSLLTAVSRKRQGLETAQGCNKSQEGRKGESQKELEYGQGGAENITEINAVSPKKKKKLHIAEKGGTSDGDS